jgi:hypothetical protein
MHIELVATDGQIQKRVLWIDYTSNGAYAGFCREGKYSHVTYHADGNYFVNWADEKPKKHGTFQPLGQFKGLFQLLGGGFGNRISSSAPSYNLKKFDAVVTVDVRNYKNGVNFSIFLVEPNNFSVVAEIIQERAEQVLVTEIHSFLQCKPWLFLVLHDFRNSKTN